MAGLAETVHAHDIPVTTSSSQNQPEKSFLLIIRELKQMCWQSKNGPPGDINSIILHSYADSTMARYISSLEQMALLLPTLGTDAPLALLLERTCVTLVQRGCGSSAVKNLLSATTMLSQVGLSNYTPPKKAVAGGHRGRKDSGETNLSHMGISYPSP